MDLLNDIFKSEDETHSIKFEFGQTIKNKIEKKL